MSDDWAQANQRALCVELERVAALLEAAGGADGGPAQDDTPRARPAALDALVAAFSLSPFERDVLLLCAGVELQSGIALLCGDAGRPTFGLALAALPDAHWSALAPTAPLRHWRMVELDEPGRSLTGTPLRIDERVLHHLVGVDYLDVQLAPMLHLVPSPAAVARSHEPVLAALRAVSGLVVLQGADAETRRTLTSAAYAQAGRPVYALAAAELPTLAADHEQLARRWEREAVFGAAVLVLEVDDGGDPAVCARAAAFADAVHAPVVISACAGPLAGRRSAAHVEVRRTPAAERRELWAAALGPRAADLNGTLDALAHFDLGAPAIDAICQHAGHEPGALWEACRVRARPRFGGLAERIDAVARWDDLVLPAGQREILREISAHVRGRSRVNEEWGFARKSARGLGITALFEGSSGTGKTMAAEVLALDLDLDLYRIDLSQVVSKYIGETERNLRLVFDAAESMNGVLLFDEADALFGTRTEVKDSHDRYANIEVSYLLQRMESYSGLAILTTNVANSIDTAFLRRLRFVVRFPFPDEAERVEIWRRVFPDRTPTADLDPVALGRLNLAGGHIRNIALGAAFLAADEDEPVRMGHVARAARRECLKLGRPLAETEVASWR